MSEHDQELAQNTAPPAAPAAQSVQVQLQDQIARVRLIADAYNNERATVLRDGIMADITQAEAALDGPDEALKEFMVAVLGAHKL